MIPKKDKLKTSNFSRNRNITRKIFLDSFLALIKKSADKSSFYVTIAKKIDKRATRRNYTKRVVYGLLKNNMSKIKNNIAAIIKMRKTADGGNLTLVKEDIIKFITFVNESYK